MNIRVIPYSAVERWRRKKRENTKTNINKTRKSNLMYISLSRRTRLGRCEKKKKTKITTRVGLTAVYARYWIRQVPRCLYSVMWSPVRRRSLQKRSAKKSDGGVVIIMHIQNVHLTCFVRPRVRKARRKSEPLNALCRWKNETFYFLSSSETYRHKRMCVCVIIITCAPAGSFSLRPLRVIFFILRSGSRVVGRSCVLLSLTIFTCERILAVIHTVQRIIRRTSDSDRSVSIRLFYSRNLSGEKRLLYDIMRCVFFFHYSRAAKSFKYQSHRVINRKREWEKVVATVLALCYTSVHLCYYNNHRRFAVVCAYKTKRPCFPRSKSSRFSRHPRNILP